MAVEKQRPRGSPLSTNIQGEDMRHVILFLSLALCVSGCTKKKEPAKGTEKIKPKSQSAKTPTAAGPKLTCATFGCTGVGTWAKKCECAGKGVKSPLSITANGEKGDRYIFTVKNTGKRDISWASYQTYHYDAAGKQLEAGVPIRGKIWKMRVSNANGSTFKYKANASKSETLGFKKSLLPTTKTVQVVNSSWWTCYG